MPKDNEVDEKVMPVACHRVRWTGDENWKCVWRNGDIPKDEAEYWEKADGPYYVERAYSDATVAELRAKADAAERRVGELEAVLHRISTMNAADDSDYGFNEWGEADCFNQVRVLATEALTGADPT